MAVVDPGRERHVSDVTRCTETRGSRKHAAGPRFSDWAYPRLLGLRRLCPNSIRTAVRLLVCINLEHTQGFVSSQPRLAPSAGCIVVVPEGDLRDIVVTLALCAGVCAALLQLIVKQVESSLFMLVAAVSGQDQ